MSGFFGVASATDCVDDLFYGTDYHSHLGTRRGGLAVSNRNGLFRFIHNIENAQFRSKFETDRARLLGHSGIGVISDGEDQPLIIGSRHGNYAIVTVSRINNLKALADEAFAARDAHFSEMSGNAVNPTELTAVLINQGVTIEEGILNAQERIEGSCSILLLTPKGIYAARDRMGRTPVTLGRREGAHCATFETCALPNLGYEPAHELGPGETVFFTADGYETRVPPRDALRICAFLWVYYGYPASTYEGRNVEAVRYQCGEALAASDSVRPDAVSGIPDSGTSHALGYSNKARIPYTRPFVKYTPTWPRSFMPQDQDVRNLVARMKLIPIRELIEGKRLLFCEDSIVRGTQLRETIQRMFQYGADEVHMRPACPPLIYGCKYLNFSQSRSELDLAGRQAIEAVAGNGASLKPFSDPDSAEYRDMVEWIRVKLGLTTLQYQRMADMVAAIGLPKSKLCTYCWDGEG
ncbi:amidophosphoribosyltransferase [bacterium]|nr:amidophosphoribosyltransferase [bacterium]